MKELKHVCSETLFTCHPPLPTKKIINLSDRPLPHAFVSNPLQNFGELEINPLPKKQRFIF